MYSHLFLVIFLVSIVSGSVEEQWRKFKLDYNKQYGDSVEKHAFEVFKRNVDEIEHHNKLYEKGLVTYKKGITKFADLTGQEFTNKYNLFQGSFKEYDEHFFNVSSNSTEYLNWKEKGAVTKVKDQGLCGACWIFSAVGVVEGHYYKKNNKLITLSEQNLIDCLSMETCQGGYPPYIFYYLTNSDNGINTADDYPHKGMRSACRYEKSRKVKIDPFNYTAVSGDEYQLKEIVKKYGPVSIAIAANGNWRLYESGIWFEKFCSERPNHAILLVGYGTENGKDYWLLKNSYGKEWGLNGYFKIARNINNNYCGIESLVMFINS